MTTNHSPQDIDRLLAEADELIQGIYSDILNEMAEEHLLQLEKHVQKLEKIKSEVHGDSNGESTRKAKISDEEIKEAIADIVKELHMFMQSIL